MDTLAVLVDELLRQTTLRALPEDIVGRPIGAVIGLFAAARSHLEAIATLARHQTGHVASPVLTRAVFEHVTTLTWILNGMERLEDLEPPVIRLGQDSNQTLEFLAKETGTRTDAERLAASQAAWHVVRPDTAFAAKMPGMKERLTGPMTQWYDRYRRLSLRSHPSLETAELALVQDGTTVSGRAQPPHVVEFALAAMMVFHAAVSIDTALNAPLVVSDGDLTSLVILSLQINQFTHGTGLTDP